ncbi:hypothetical protein B9G55_06165 [Saccharibacillus sp. O16]|nr:hypothetical protein B9G55_06165 [Saccharibacillus sp. O16]
MKNNNRFKRSALRAFFGLGIATIAAIVAFCYPFLLKNALVVVKQEHNELNMTGKQREVLIDELSKGNYALPLLYWREHGNTAQPSDLYLQNMNESSDPAQQAKDKDFQKKFNKMISSWEGSFISDGPYATVGRYGMEYMVYYHPSQEMSTNSLKHLDQFAASSMIGDKQLMSQFAFYAVIRYKSDGTMTIPAWYGMEEKWKEKIMRDHLKRTTFYERMEEMTSALQGPFDLRPALMSIQNPADFTIFYGLPRETYADPGSYERSEMNAFATSGLGTIWLSAAGAAALLGIWAAREFRRNRQRVLQDNQVSVTGSETLPRLPLEFWLAGVLLPLVGYRMFAGWSYHIAQSEAGISTLLPSLYAWLVWLVLLGFWFGLAKVLTEAVQEGFSASIQRRSWAIRAVNWTKKSLRQSIAWVHTFDPADRSDHFLIKMAVFHFALMTILILLAVYIGYYALALLLLYGIVLFIKAKMTKDRLQRAYGQLHAAVQSMAEGSLELEWAEDVQVFEPLKQELQRVREKVKQAVEEESKSQRMKSELITNVSHDLKTPLTALSTYINLLQQPQITDEERNTYIAVLATKSQRLNRLVEDLFEYTQASSGNTAFTPIQVDVVELLQQAHVELQAEIDKSGLQLRFMLPAHKVFLPLDSEKTFRVFENLYLNMAKYSMPGSRAYIEVDDTEQDVRVTFKNISEKELDFDTAEITERFVRGDQSRHTEGSGLGLAIVKSLVEIQNGTFTIEVDGDLFKAIIKWPKA